MYNELWKLPNNVQSEGALLAGSVCRKTYNHILFNKRPSRKNLAPLTHFHWSCVNQGKENETVLLVLYQHILRDLVQKQPL